MVSRDEKTPKYKIREAELEDAIVKDTKASFESFLKDRGRTFGSSEIELDGFGDGKYTFVVDGVRKNEQDGKVTHTIYIGVSKGLFNTEYLKETAEDLGRSGITARVTPTNKNTYGGLQMTMPRKMPSPARGSIVMEIDVSVPSDKYVSEFGELAGKAIYQTFSSYQRTKDSKAGKTSK